MCASATDRFPPLFCRSCWIEREVIKGKGERKCLASLSAAVETNGKSAVTRRALSCRNEVRD